MTSTPKKQPRKSSTVVAKTTRKKSEKKSTLPPNPFVNEILDYVSNLKSKIAKVEALKEYRNDALVSILIWNFDDTVVSMIPEGDVPFTPNDSPQGTDHTSLRREQRNLYHFVKGGNDTLNGIRRETMFIQMLEGLHPSEARIIILAKDGRLSDEYSITYEQVKEAYPDITWGGRS
jgi:hypothetical protein